MYVLFLIKNLKAHDTVRSNININEDIDRNINLFVEKTSIVKIIQSNVINFIFLQPHMQGYITSTNTNYIRRPILSSITYH